MKNAFAPYFSLTAVSAVALAFSAPAHAAGVSAGTMIENTASATYTSGSSSVTLQSNTVSLRVDELLDVAVAGLTTTPVTAGNTEVVLAYSVTNTGNGPESYNITVNPTVSGNDFDATIQSVVVDTNGNGVYDAGVDQVLTSGAATPSIAADSSLTIFIIATLPSGANDGDASQIRLAAEAVTGTGTPGAVFAGQGEGGGDAVVGASGAKDDALDTIVASLSAVSLVKSATIVDQFGGTQPVPGATVTFTIVASVSGTGTADNLHVTDAIPAGTTYQAGTLKLDSAALTDASDADVGVASTSGVDVNLGSIAGGSTKTISFNVKIN